MSIFFFILGVIVLRRDDVPPAIMGGSVKHIVSPTTAKLIGWLLMLPFIMDVLRLLGLRALLPYPLLVLYIIVSWLLPIAALAIYYLNRYPRPTYGIHLVDTDIPAEHADFGQWIADQAYQPMALILFCFFVPLNLIAGPAAIARTSRAIRASREVGFGVAQRQFAQVLRIIALLATVLPVACGGIALLARIPPREARVADDPIPSTESSDDEIVTIVTSIPAKATLIPTVTPFPIRQGDGVERIVFISVVEYDAITDIYTANPDGSDMQRLTEGDALNMDVSWSPDGLYIAFLSDRAGGENMRLYRMDADGSNVIELVGLDRMIYDTVWSPDGTQIAFSMEQRDAEEYNQELFVVNADGSGLRSLTSTVYESEHSPSWSPDGSQLVYSSSGFLYIINADGSGSYILLRDGANAAWSPNGQWIAFANFDRLGFIRPDGTGEYSIPLPFRRGAQLSWSPDGQFIVLSPTYIYSLLDSGLYILRLSDSVFTRIPFGEDGIFVEPAWQQP